MSPSNLPVVAMGYKSSGQRVPLSHSGMIPWTAEWVAKIANEGLRAGQNVREPSDTVDPVGGRDANDQQTRGATGMEWTTAEVLKICRENARAMYGI